MSWVSWPLRLGYLVLWFIGQVLRSNLRLIRDILTRGGRAAPLVARFDTDCRGDLEVALLAILVSLTPGTLVLAIAHELEGEPAGQEDPLTRPTTLFVHTTYLDWEQLLTDLEAVEEHLLSAVRRKGVQT